MSITFYRPSGVNVGINNPNEISYIKGNEFTDGSRRAIVGTDNRIQIQERKNGVWNLTELEISSNTLHMGHDLSLSAIGSNLQIRSVSDPLSRLLVLDIPISDIGTGVPRTPIASPRLDRVVTQPIFSNEFITQSVQLPITVDFDPGFVYALYFKVGSVGASDDIVIKVTEGLVPGGILFFERTYPSSDFSANTEVKIVLESGLGYTLGENLSFDISSNSDFSLLGVDSSNPWLGCDFQGIEFEELISTPIGTNKFVVGKNDGNIMVDNFGNLMTFK